MSLARKPQPHRRTNPGSVVCAAVDCGATSGRVIVGRWSDSGLHLEEVHRFPNGFHSIGGRDYWDFAGIWEQIRAGLSEAARRFPNLASVGVDFWGVDHALVDRTGRLVYPVHAYRDTRTEPGRLRLARRGLPALYRATGIPNLFYNSSLQLEESLRSHPGLRSVARRCLFLPDYVNFLLCGVMAAEVSIASTSQLLSVKGLRFSDYALRRFGVPRSWFPRVRRAGGVLGPVRGLSGLERVSVVCVPGHDTACAYAAMPASMQGGDLFLSSGTWSLVGCESDQPFLSDEALSAGVTNERLGDGRFAPQMSFAGLWLLERVLQESGRILSGDAAWDAFFGEVGRLPEPAALVGVRDPSLANPTSMRDALARLLRRSRKAVVPNDAVGWARLIVSSLGAAHAGALRQFERLSGRRFHRILITGGGARNRLLCQATADHAGLPVHAIAGEGTAAGNLAHQLVALGAVESIATFRRLWLRNSPPRIHLPATSRRG
ncbi:rhamnulokinase [mine drainage metagenome]|uniref:Rhamnulokinase n=1 Tax=mine drainage metagenome TaxID=410659 RepID=A0A1J5RU02_9ZZZZ